NHYDEFAQYFPEFCRLKELSKITIVMRLLENIRLNNQTHLEALNHVLNPGHNTEPTTDIYKDYKEHFHKRKDSLLQSLNELRENYATSVLEGQWQQKLLEIQEEIGSLTFHPYSSEVCAVCDKWLEQLQRQNPGISSYRLREDCIAPKREEIAQE